MYLFKWNAYTMNINLASTVDLLEPGEAEISSSSAGVGVAIGGNAKDSGRGVSRRTQIPVRPGCDETESGNLTRPEELGRKTVDSTKRIPGGEHALTLDA